MGGVRRTVKLGLASTALATAVGVGAFSPADAASGAARLHQVHWGAVSVPGAVCSLGSKTIALDNGAAIRPTPPGVQSGTADIVIKADTTHVAYGTLSGSPVAALNVWCSNSGGTADGQLFDNWVVYTSPSHGPHVLSVLTPQQPADVQVDHVPSFDASASGLSIHRSSVTVHERWYGLDDTTCCPSGRATTVWSDKGGTLSVTRTTVQRQPRGPKLVKVVPAVANRLNDVVGYASVTEVDVKADAIELSMTCGSLGSSSGWIQLDGVHLVVDSNVAQPAHGHLQQWSARRWVAFVATHGWVGNVDLVKAPPTLSDDPHASNCLNSQ